MKERAMGFVSFVGRVLFASIFLLSAYKEASEFGTDGGPAAKSLEPKFNLFVKHLFNNTGMVVPHVQIKTVIVATVYLRAFGGCLLILNSTFGAFLLLVYLLFITPVVIMYDFYKSEIKSPQYVQLYTQFLQNMALYGALLFFWEMNNSIALRHSKRRTQRPIQLDGKCQQGFVVGLGSY
ncbi:unnamed protein product [Alopecurus aequalis]